MKKLETSFAGLTLKNPFIVSSCSLTNTAQRNKKWEDAGASAVVLKSWFDDEIEAELAMCPHDGHSELEVYLRSYARSLRLEN